MLLLLDNGWIELKNYLPYLAGELLRKGRATEALPLFINSWSEDAPINEYWCKMLKPQVASRIFEEMRKQMEFILSFPPEELFGIIEGFLKGGTPELHDEKISKLFQEYYIPAFLLFDHKGNLHTLPYPGGLVDQPWDQVYFWRFYKSAFVKWLADQQKSASLNLRR